ncbi:hypothetical protein L7F22_049635 [Adiantum nelumboides]|nr:hypothetical protein [Adiantum nelumboides]
MRPNGGNIRGRGSTHAMVQESSYEALQSMLTGEYTEESTGARTIRQTGGKDRHSKVFTSRGPRDRRVRLSVATAIRFYDLQDRLGFEQPSKAVEWLLLHCQPSIKALPQLGAFHRPQGRVGVLSAPDHQPAHFSNRSPPPTSDMDIKPSHGNVIQHERVHKRYRFSNSSQFVPLQPQQNRMQECFQNANSSLDTHSFLYDIHPQDSTLAEEDPPQCSNPSSSGGSSDHPTSLSKPSQKKSIEHTISTKAILPSCFSEVNINHHTQADNCPASLTAESNAACDGITPEEHHRRALALSQRLLGASNMMSHQDHYSLIESNTGKMYEIPSSDSFSLIGNYMNMDHINAPIRQGDFAINSALGQQGTQTDANSAQRMMQVPASMADSDKYVNIAQSHLWRAQTNAVEIEAPMSTFQVVQEDSLPVNLEDTLRFYGTIGICGATTTVSPSESNNTNIPSAINYSNHEQFSRPSLNWALKHALM